MSFVEAAILRLSPLRRGNLQRRLMERVEACEASTPYGDKYEDGTDAVSEWAARSLRAYAVLGRFLALTAGLEVR